MRVVKRITNLSVVILSVILILSFTGVVFFGLYRVINPTVKEKSIVVVNKTTEIVSHGFSSATAYLILADDDIVYRTRDWKIYNDMKVNKRYNVKAKLVHKMRYPSNFWTIEEVEEVQEE